MSRISDWRLVVAALPALMLGCGDAAERVNCNDLLPPAQVRYADVQALFMAESGKGCAATACHGRNVAEKGYRFDEPSLVYDVLSTRLGPIYSQVASGKMPEDGTRWSEDDLRLLRSWYCHGAYPDE